MAKKKQKKQTQSKQKIHEPSYKIPILNAFLPEPVIRTSKPKINLNVCTNNYNCIVYCPHNAISKNDKGRPVIDYNLCTGCMICLRECPTGAIFEERE